MHEELLEKAKDGLVLKYAFNGSPVPEGWDAPAFCSNLALAEKGEGLGLAPCNANRVSTMVHAHGTGVACIKVASTRRFINS